jgi:25S rRNA (uracil2634-N3)-methyltransferase
MSGGWGICLPDIGDFSFSLALKHLGKAGQITATCYDSKDVLETKYPDVQKTIAQLESAVTDNGESSNGEEPEWKGLSPSPPGSPLADTDLDQEKAPGGPAVTVLYGIDAVKLSSAHKKALRTRTPFTKIVFNFPHVGGLSTDVNRQVRYNQELLVGFFKAAKPLLSSPTRPARVQLDGDDSEQMSGGSDHRDRGAVNGQILVTLFEGEPYTLWNIRDLARHCGLKVVESFKFPWSAYAGYRHARTVGDITTGKDRSAEGKRKGAWRGEERDARCYVLEDKDAPAGLSPNKKTRQSRENDDSD